MRYGAYVPSAVKSLTELYSTPTKNTNFLGKNIHMKPKVTSAS